MKKALMMIFSANKGPCYASPQYYLLRENFCVTSFLLLYYIMQQTRNQVKNFNKFCFWWQNLLVHFQEQTFVRNDEVDQESKKIRSAFSCVHVGFLEFEYIFLIRITQMSFNVAINTKCMAFW
jgi:hypothetical protein